MQESLFKQTLLNLGDFKNLEKDVFEIYGKSDGKIERLVDDYDGYDFYYYILTIYNPENKMIRCEYILETSLKNLSENIRLSDFSKKGA